jgi:hypothetical protein
MDVAPATGRSDDVMETLTPADSKSANQQPAKRAVASMSPPSDPAPDLDPTIFWLANTFGSKEQLAELLKVDMETVSRMEAEHRIFSYQPHALEHRVYGRYQALEGISEGPLAAVLACFFNAMDAGTTWMKDRHIASFLRLPNNMLAWVTPLEALLGYPLYDAPLEEEATWLFKQDSRIRLNAVLRAAHDELMHRRI